MIRSLCMALSLLSISLPASADELNRVLATQAKPTSTLKKSIVNAARDYLYDPYSVRDAEISSVVLVNKGTGLHAVCVKANAKNQYGGYTGRNVVSVRIMKGVPVSTLPNALLCRSPKLKWYRFKELERLKDI